LRSAIYTVDLELKYPFFILASIEHDNLGFQHFENIVITDGAVFGFLVPDCTRKKKNLAKKWQQSVKFFATKLQINRIMDM